MTSAEQIADKLPHFYMSWDRDTVVSALIGALGRALDNMEDDLVEVMRAHWADYAEQADLEHFGELCGTTGRKDESWSGCRARIRTAILTCRGGGTPETIKSAVRLAMGLPGDYPMEMLENPPVPREMTWQLKSGGEWLIVPASTGDSRPSVTITLPDDGARAVRPAIVNLDTGESVTFDGTISSGDSLKIEGDRAFLNGNDVSGQLLGSVPVMPRRKTKWAYREMTGYGPGAFDLTPFGLSACATDARASITFAWEATLPACFLLMIPQELLKWSGIDPEYLKEVVANAKAGGVRVGIIVYDPNELEEEREA